MVAWTTRRGARVLAETPTRLAFFTLLSLVTTWPLLGSGDHLNLFRDAQYLFSYERDAVAIVSRFGQAPLWDPYYCGGFYALGSPQTRFVSPTFLLSLIFGAARAQGLVAFVMILMGLEGTYRYARSYGGGGAGGVLAAALFALSGCFAAIPFLGWTNFYGFELLPWAALGARSAVRGRPSGLIVASLAVAWMIGFGGTYAAPMTAIVCAYEVLLAAWRDRTSPPAVARILAIAALAGLLTAGLAGIRIWPIVETLVRAPRALYDRSGARLEDLVTALVEPVRARGGNLVSSRYMYVVGLFAIPATLAGLIRKRVWPLTAFGLFAFWTATGYAHGWSPFVAFKQIPPFSALRYPERYLIVVALVLAVASASGLRALQARARRSLRWSCGMLALSAALVANISFLISDHHLMARRRLLAPAPPTLDREFQQARGNRWAAAFYQPMSRGSLSCFDDYPVPMSPRLRGDLVADEYFPDASAGTVTRRLWSPMRIDLDVFAAKSARLAVNQNYHPGWRTSVGTVIDDGGLLSVDVPAGHHQLRLRFVPRSAIGGGAASVAALLVVGWLAFGARRRDEFGRKLRLRNVALASLAPLAAAATVWTLMAEPAIPRPVPRAPNGELIVTDRVTPDAALFGVQFENGVSLVAARLAGTDGVPGGKHPMLELDFRIDRQPAAGTVVVVHAESDRSEHRAFDHVLLSAWKDLSRAPRGPIVRDFVPLPLHRPGGRRNWTIRVGLKSADGARVRVQGSGPTAAINDALEVGTLPVE